jgi:hypothetical protein
VLKDQGFFNPVPDAEIFGDVPQSAPAGAPSGQPAINPDVDFGGRFEGDQEALTAPPGGNKWDKAGEAVSAIAGFFAGTHGFKDGRLQLLEEDSDLINREGKTDSMLYQDEVWQEHYADALQAAQLALTKGAINTTNFLSGKVRYDTGIGWVSSDTPLSPEQQANNERNGEWAYAITDAVVNTLHETGQFLSGKTKLNIGRGGIKSVPLEPYSPEAKQEDEARERSEINIDIMDEVIPGYRQYATPTARVDPDTSSDDISDFHLQRMTDMQDSMGG